MADDQDDRKALRCPREAAQNANPKNIRAVGEGIRLALVGEPLPDDCKPHTRRGFAIGGEILAGRVAFERGRGSQ